jgi:hypothetical protein
MKMVLPSETLRSPIKAANPRLIAPELTIQKMLEQLDQDLDRLAQSHRDTRDPH